MGCLSQEGHPSQVALAVLVVKLKFFSNKVGK